MLSWLGTSSTALVSREILRFVRQRSRWIGALATPLLMWIVVGAGFQGSFRDSTQGMSTDSYWTFFFPGSVALSVLFTAIFSTMSVIEDRNQGFLQGVLVSPLGRLNIVIAKVVGGALLGTLQGVLLLAVAPWAGFALSFWSFTFAVTLIFVMGGCLTALGFIFAWVINSTQGYHGVMNLILLPMWMLSGSLFPVSTSHSVLKTVAEWNPLSYGVHGLRFALSHPWPFVDGWVLAIGAPIVGGFALAVALCTVSRFLISRR